MLTDTTLRSAVDALWDKLWSGGLSNPLDAIEQLSFLLFLKRLEEKEQDNERAARRRGGKFKPTFPKKELRCSHWTQLPAGDALKAVREEVFPFIKTLGGAGGSFAAQMENAEFKINKPSLLIEACRAIDAFLPAAFLKLFGDLRLKDHHWSFAELERHAEIASGIAKGQKYGSRETVDVPYLRVANVQDGYLDLSEIKTIRALPSDVELLRLKPGDIVMTEGGDFDKLGRGAIWPGGMANCIHQNHIFRVRLDSAKLLPTLFSAFLRSAAAKEYFLRCSKQTTNLASINITQLRATPVPLPPLTIQRHFAAVVARHQSLRASQREALRQADHLFQSLLHHAFSENG